MVELKIQNMAYGGQGIAHLREENVGLKDGDARLNGFVLFVKGAIPGDRIEARVIQKKRDYAEAQMTALLDPSPDRVQAPCPYNGFCGGCQWQHVAYERQLGYKKDHVKDAVSRIGDLAHVLVHDVIPSEKQFAYRNKMEFSFSDRRWVLPDEFNERKKADEFALGLHVPGTYSKVIDVETCLLQPKKGNHILREVKRFVKQSRLPVYGLKSHQGFWRFLTLRYSTHLDEWMVNLITAEERPSVLKPLAEVLSLRFDNLKTIINNVHGGRASIAVGKKETIYSGDGTIQDRIGPFSFQISANSFFQTNSRGAEVLYNKVKEFAELTGSELVLDLYSGTGTIPIFLSNQAKEIVGIEITQSAVRDAERNCEINGILNCRFILGDIKEKLTDLRMKPDVLIIDPPRAGMHKDVLSRVMDLGTERIVYISCNPSTLARDMKIMSQDYRVVEIQPVDMFPHTFHIESVAKLVRFT
jgi:23S rRNA (uracil1939-C5)-methyltransferase